MIHHTHQPVCQTVQPDQPGDGSLRDHGGGDVQPGSDAVLGHDLCLADLGAAHADRACRNLQFGDVGALMGFGMRPKLHALGTRKIGHGGDVAAQRIQIDNQHRRIEVPARALLADQRAVQFLIGHVSGSGL